VLYVTGWLQAAVLAEAVQTQRGFGARAPAVGVMPKEPRIIVSVESMAVQSGGLTAP
jgi:hypothetical protein